MPIEDEDVVQTKLVLDAVQAIKAMNDLAEKADTYSAKLDVVIQAQRDFALAQGMKDSAAKKLFDDLISRAERYRTTLAEAEAAQEKMATGAKLTAREENAVFLADVIKNDQRINDFVNNVRSPFVTALQGAAGKDVSSQMSELARAEQNAQKVAMGIADTQAKQVVERQRLLELANQEQIAVEKEGAELQRQLGLYGQISRTSAETAQYLQRFAGTQQGQSILTKFFGNYQQAAGTIAQIDVLKSSIRELATATGSTFAQAGKAIEQQFSNIPGITTQTSTAVKELNSEFDKIPQKTSRATIGVNALRIALGVLVSMLIFQVIQAFQNAFREAINNIRESELAIYNLINAERRLSQQGIEVTPKGLQETIDAVKKLAPILSQIQAQELVSRISTNVAPALKLGNEQIKQMATSVALLYVRNKALGKSFDEVESQLTNAFLTGRVSQGINNLGVKLSDQIVRDEALRMGLVKTAKEFDNLSGEMEAHVKAVAMLSVVYKNATQDIGSVGDYMQTTDAQIESVKTSWSDLLTVLGKIFGPFLSEGLKVLANGLNIILAILEKSKGPLETYVAMWVAFFETIKGKGISIFTPSGIAGILMSNEFAKNLDKAKKSFQELSDATDTATGAQQDWNNTAAEFDAEGFKQKVEDIVTDANNARADLEEKLGQKRDDIEKEYTRKAADAERDLQRKIEDINRDAARDLANLKDKQRKDDIKAEEDYQLRLWELQQRYLMDLEDALHARDARQVIRLQKQYEIDKEALARKKGLDDKQREEDQKAAIEDIEIKRKQRIEDAKLEYQQKLEDQRIAKQRELDDLAVWYKRELDDLQTNIQRKLEALIKGWIDEEKLTASGAATVYGILYKYFGPGGMTDALYQYMATQLKMPLGIPSIGGLMPGAITTGTPSSTGGVTGGRLMGSTSTSGGGSSTRRAEGGTFLASRPTTMTFGEAGLEMATFTPLTRLGKDTGKVFGMGGAGGGVNGNIQVELLLSPDLEARVVKSSMDGVANVVAKVNRIKR